MITLENGHAFEYMAASGSLGLDGRGYWWERAVVEPSLFTIVLKTLTLNPHRGNFSWLKPLESVWIGNKGIVNDYGLTNPGLDWWLERIGNKSFFKDRSVIVSLQAGNDVPTMAWNLRNLPIKGIEINNCPNYEQAVATSEVLRSCEFARRMSGLPVLLKVSYGFNIAELAKSLVGLVDAVSINSVPWRHVLPGKVSPLGGLRGSISGHMAQPYTWEMVEQFKHHAGDSLKVIAPSIWEYGDIEKVRNLGADAISFGSIFLRYPWRPAIYVKRDIMESSAS